LLPALPEIHHASTLAQLTTLAVLKTPSASTSQLHPQPPQRPALSPDRPQTQLARLSSAVSVAAAVLHRLVAVAARPALPLPFSSVRLTVCLPLLPVSSAALLFCSKKKSCCLRIPALLLFPLLLSAVFFTSHSFCNSKHSKRPSDT
jgi:hypothetical protein